LAYTFYSFYTVLPKYHQSSNRPWDQRTICRHGPMSCRPSSCGRATCYSNMGISPIHPEVGVSRSEDGKDLCEMRKTDKRRIMYFNWASSSTNSFISLVGYARSIYTVF